MGHWDALFGISGDMALGSLLDAGADLAAVNRALGGLGVPGLRVELGRVSRAGLACSQVRVVWDRAPEQHGHEPGRHGSHVHRPYPHIRQLLEEADVAPVVRARAQAVFARLAAAEAAVHGTDPEHVHLHEVGAEDAMGDVVGVAAALEDLGIVEITASALPAGGGTVSAAHGTLPVPAPAVARLLVGWEMVPGPVAAELVTPTGAALLAALARPAASWPALRLEGGGWGAGQRDFPHHPNACRFVWGTREPQSPTLEMLLELETHLDDQTPEQIAFVAERLFAAGALDVATSPLGMKKQRPGVRLWALVRPGESAAARAVLFAESTALGIRERPVRRWSLERSLERVTTPLGEVRVKVGREGAEVRNVAPEYEDCAALAREHGIPLKEVMALARLAWQRGRELR